VYNETLETRNMIIPGMVASIRASLDLSSMPRVMQFLSYAVPARYFVTLIEGIALKRVGHPWLCQT
jgi:hypothetical protein